MSEVTEQEFNKYCAKVMGYDVNSWKDELFFMDRSSGWDEYDPYNDLNQMAEVVEKLLDKDFVHGIDKLTMYLNEGHSVDIKQAFRDFIISTMDD